MMAWVGEWFCECGSSVSMSFCTAHLSVAAWPGTASVASTATTAAANMRANVMMISSFSLLYRKRFLDQRRKIAGAERNHVVVEIVVRIVQEAVKRTTALAEPGVGTGARLQHIRKVLAAHRRLPVGMDIALAEDLLPDLGRKQGLALGIDRGGIAALIVDLGRAAERLGDACNDFA